MEIPKQIQVGGKTYSIITGYKFQERSDRIGHCDNVQQKIVISDVDGNGNMAHIERVEETFIHEIIHAIDCIYNAGKLDDDTVCRLSEGFTQVLKQLLAV